jgi:hypothetical protein
MADSQLSLTISLIMIGLFTIAVIGFGIGFANDTGASVSIADDDDVNQVYTQAKDNLSNFKTESEGTYESILATTIEPGSDVMPSAGPISGTRESFVQTGKNAVTLPLNYIFGGFGSPFGIFFVAFFAIIALMFALYLIKTWRGNP